MQPINNDDDLIDCHAIEHRLRRVEDALISIQTIMNLLMDLLERALPRRAVGDDEIAAHEDD